MSRRRELLRRIAGLTEIREILGAMKGLALVELRHIGEHADAQRHAVHEIEAAIAEFLAFYRDALPRTAPPHQGIRCVIGSERGFCGDFNVRIATYAQHAAAALPEHVILVGDKLADAWPGPVAATLRITGPSIADEVPATLTALLETIARLAAQMPAAAPALTVVHDSVRGIRTRQLLPLPEPRLRGARPAFAPQLQLAPAPCFEALVGQYLDALLHALFSMSMLAENRRRLQHMDQALHRLDERLELLQRRQNQQRQEDIIEEIEVILLTVY